MRIYRVSRAFFPVVDGAAHHVWGLSRAQTRLGHHVCVVQPHVTAWPGGESVMLHRVPMGVLHPYLYRSKAVLGAFAVRAALAVRRRHRGHPADVVHVHGDAVEAACVGAWARPARVPLVLTVHGGLNTGRRYTRWAPTLFRFVTRFIAVSPSVREQLIGLDVASDRIAVISSGIDLSRFPRSERRPQPNPVHIATVGRLHRVKGFDLLIAAVRRLHEAGHRVRLTIAGEGPERAMLRAAVGDLPGIELAGAMSPDEVAQLLRAADIFAMPSVDVGSQAEGTPTAVLEAMAAALPVVVSDSGGLPQLVRDGVNGLVVPQGDVARLAEAILTLVGDAAMRRKLGDENRQLAEGRDWAVVAAGVDAVYREAIEEHARR